MNDKTLTPFDGDFDAAKRLEYERLIVAIADDGLWWISGIEYDEEIAISSSNFDYSELAVDLKTPKYFEDKDTGDIFIDEISTDTYNVPLPPGWTAKEIEELFGRYTVYFRLTNS